MLCFTFSKTFISSSLGIKPVNAGRESPHKMLKEHFLAFPLLPFWNWRCSRGSSFLCSPLHLKWANRMPSSARLVFYPSFNIFTGYLWPQWHSAVGLVNFCWIFTLQNIWACLLPVAFLSNERKLNTCRWVLCLCVINTIKISIIG